MKRGVELSMNVIIIAAIALIVLVILVLLVTNASKDVRSGTGCQQLNHGQCIILDEGESCSDVLGGGYVSTGQKDCAQDETCCWMPLGGGGE